MSKPKRKDAAGRGDEDLENSILAKLTREHQQVNAGEEFANDVTILFCGSKRCGKTSLVDRFINPSKDEKDQPKPTVALDYKFARYASENSTSKVLAHIYDLGGEESNDNLVAIPMSPSTVGNLVLAVVLDLSEPHTALPTLEKWLKLLQAYAAKSLEGLVSSSESGAKRAEAVRASRQEAFAAHPDAGVVNPFPVQLVIFGSKWDVLVAEHDREKVKGLCRAIRYFAHVNGASLVFSSLKDKTAMNSVRAVIRQLLFGATAKGGLPEQLDPAKPLCIAAGKDSIQGIGAPHGAQASDRAWRDTVADYFPDPNRLNKDAKKSDSAQLADELPKFPESSIDGMVEQRLEELQQYRRQVERNQRLASEGITSKEGATFAAG